jgi:hypothetical protein
MTEEQITNAFSPETNAEVARLFEFDIPKQPPAKVLKTLAGAKRAGITKNSKK